MYYILDRTGPIVGSADGLVDATDLATRGEIAVPSELNLEIAHVDVVGSRQEPILIAKEIPAPMPIVLATSAQDTDGDGLAELPADGESKAEITATLYDALGEVIKDNVEVQFRTSAGALSSRYAVTKKGQATVELKASRETVMASVSASAAGFEPATIEFEFLPEEKSERKSTKK